MPVYHSGGVTFLSNDAVADELAGRAGKGGNGAPGGQSNVGGFRFAVVTSGLEVLSVGAFNVQPLPNGAQCSKAAQCTSLHCIDGFCCDTECDGVCAVCNAPAGRCSMPASDARCPVTADCPKDGDCYTYVASPASGNCVGLGVCEEPCTRLRAPERSRCAAGSGLCSDHGDCLRPTVSCGPIASSRICEANPGLCCRQWAGTVGSPIIGEAACIGADETCSPPPEGGRVARIGCDGPEDCALGDVCCGAWLGNPASALLSFSVCKAEAECVPIGMPGYRTVVCHEDGDCASLPGNSCIQDLLSELKRCRGE